MHLNLINFHLNLMNSHLNLVNLHLNLMNLHLNLMHLHLMRTCVQRSIDRTDPTRRKAQNQKEVSFLPEGCRHEKKASSYCTYHS